jgi:hypothetical protein
MNDETQAYADNAAGTALRLTAFANSTILHTVAQRDGHRTGPVSIPTAELLAMIDRSDPDAMRAYLRETAPDFVADTLRPDYAEGGVTAALIDREVPEADSPEDVDEHRDRDDPTERAQLDRAWALELAHKLFPHAGSLLAVKVAAWIIDGQQR